MLERLPKRVRRTLAADKAYDTTEFVTALRERQVTPHVACNQGRKDGRPLRKMKVRGLAKVRFVASLVST